MNDNRTVMDVLDGRAFKATIGIASFLASIIILLLAFISNTALNKIEVMDEKINAINNQLATVTDLSRRVGYLEVRQRTFYVNGRVP